MNPFAILLKSWKRAFGWLLTLLALILIVWPMAAPAFAQPAEARLLVLTNSPVETRLPEALYLPVNQLASRLTAEGAGDTSDADGVQSASLVQPDGSMSLAEGMNLDDSAQLADITELDDGTELADSAKLFELHCAGCHIHGGNIVRRGKTLKLKALKKYQMDSVEAIAEIITLGRGNMSAYQDRLTPAQIQALAGYVLEQAQQDWPN